MDDILPAMVIVMNTILPGPLMDDILPAMVIVMNTIPPGPLMVDMHPAMFMDIIITGSLMGWYS